MRPRHCRLPFTQLTLVEKDSPNFAKQVAEQAQHYSSWRDVQTDGNCFYRAVAYSLLEHYCRPFTPLSELEGFCKRLWCQETEPLRDEDIPHYKLVLQVLLQLCEKKRNSNLAMQAALDLLEIEDFMHAMIRVLRFVAWSAIIAYQPNPYYEGFEETEDMRGILEWGRASGDLDASGIAWGLDISIKLVEMGRANVAAVVSRFEPGRRVHAHGPHNELPADPKGRLCFHVGLNAGHFVVFYPKDLELLEEEQEGRYQVKRDCGEEEKQKYALLMR